jgi:hypothetical protein
MVTALLISVVGQQNIGWSTPSTKEVFAYAGFSTLKNMSRFKTINKIESAIKTGFLHRGANRDRSPTNVNIAMGAITTKRYLPIKNPIYFVLKKINIPVPPTNKRKITPSALA